MVYKIKIYKKVKTDYTNYYGGIAEYTDFKLFVNYNMCSGYNLVITNQVCKGF